MAIRDWIQGGYSKRQLKKVKPIADKVAELEDKFKAMSDAELKAMTGKLKTRLANGETLDDILPEAFATCREASDRVIGLRHYYVQIVGGIILHQGRIAEMRTGEGKTLVATLPAYLNALSGEGVHIVTVNDYLARRDSEWMGKIYRFLGLTVGLIIQSGEKNEKKAEYACDITYCTNNELGFDYLRDNMVTYKEQKVQRGHNFAVVDEVDSILVDDARTPLIISGQGEKSSDLYIKADKFARSLKKIVVRETDDKADNDELHNNGDYIVDEKARTCTLTANGVKKAEKFFSLENLNDPENMTVAHHINQAIRAHGIMRLDIEYVVHEGEIIIVDENTGRLMFGRRYNEGLHQAIEAKEGVEVEHESKTLATITFQNFFRLYKKLSGMTGTAMTESQEFSEIYKLDVIEIPTNMPMIRFDHTDVVYKTVKAKYDAVCRLIEERHNAGQPVLVGTVSIEKSEHLSAMLKKRGIKHVVLNAKNHAKEAEIVAQAGKIGSVTIATNMAGRGTDIVLGGNAEYMAKNEMRKKGFEDELIVEATGFADTDNEEIINARKTFSELEKNFKKETKAEAEQVCAVGGLYIIGTERHESRRIDNQLRGRAGRQGDPGDSKFFIALEDDLMRLFGGERLYNMMETLRVDENTPLEMGMLARSIENAQKKVETRNFMQRKHVLEYDDVMNTQRHLIYSQRDKVLNGDSLKDIILTMIRETVDSHVDLYCNDSDAGNWNLASLREYFSGWLPISDSLKFDANKLNNIDKEEVADIIYNIAEETYELREKNFGNELMRELERVILLRAVDSHWMDHIDAMDELRNGIGLRGYGQRDPVVEYRNEGYEMFTQMTESIREETMKMVLCVQIKSQDDAAMQRKRVAKVTKEGMGSNVAQENAVASGGSGDGSEKRQPVRKKVTAGRNDPCPCGSGKKYKKCCGLE